MTISTRMPQSATMSERLGRFVSEMGKGRSVRIALNFLRSPRSLAALFALEIAMIVWFAFFGGTAQGGLQLLLHVDDKTMHVAAFTCAGLTAFLLWPPIASASILFASAALVEIIQRFIPGRDSSLSDFAASLSGGALGAAAALMVAAPMLCRLGSEYGRAILPVDERSKKGGAQ